MYITIEKSKHIYSALWERSASSSSSSSFQNQSCAPPPPFLPIIHTSCARLTMTRLIYPLMVWVRLITRYSNGSRSGAMKFFLSPESLLPSFLPMRECAGLLCAPRCSSSESPPVDWRIHLSQMHTSLLANFFLNFLFNQSSLSFIRITSRTMLI